MTTDSARHRMLDAAAVLWDGRPTAEVFGGLSVSTIARAAGVQRSTFYAHWPTTEAYLRDLVAHLADPVWGSTSADPNAASAALGTGGFRLLDRLLASCDGHVAALLADRRFPLRMGLMARAADPAIADALHRAQWSAARAYVRQTGQVDALWGRVTRPPLDGTQLLMVFNALAESVARLHLLDPERFPIAIYGQVAMSILLVATRHPDDSRDLLQMLDSINEWPVTMPVRRPRASSLDGTPLTDDEVQDLIIEARRLAGVEGWPELSLGRLAAQTTTPEFRLQRAFGSRAGLTLAIYLFSVAERFAELETTDDALADLRTMIAVKADELRRTPAFAPAISSIIAGSATYSRPHSFAFDPHRRFVDTIRRAQEQDRLDRSLDPTELAHIVDDTILFTDLRVTARNTSVADPVELVLRGAGAAPAGRH